MFAQLCRHLTLLKQEEQNVDHFLWFVFVDAGGSPDSAAREDLIFEARVSIWLQNMDDNRLRFWRRLDLIPAFYYFTQLIRDVLRRVVSISRMLKICTVLFQLQLCKTIMIESREVLL